MNGLTLATSQKIKQCEPLNFWRAGCSSAVVGHGYFVLGLDVVRLITRFRLSFQLIQLQRQQFCRSIFYFVLGLALKQSLIVLSVAETISFATKLSLW